METHLNNFVPLLAFEVVFFALDNRLIMSKSWFQLSLGWSCVVLVGCLFP